MAAPALVSRQLVRPALLALAATLALALPAPAQANAACTASKALYGNGCNGLVLDADALPCIPNPGPFNFVLSGIPTGSIANLVFVAPAQPPVPIDLTSIGMTGCMLHLAPGGPFPMLYASHWGNLATNPIDMFPSGFPNFAIFTTAWWNGVALYCQGVALVPGINLASVIASNGLLLVGG